MAADIGRRLRSLPRRLGIRLVAAMLAVSRRSSAADRQRGLDAGADGYIVKSGFDESGLLAAVNRLLGSRA